MTKFLPCVRIPLPIWPRVAGAAVARLVFLLPAALPAQDPPAPPGGFAVSERRDLDVTWSDGYRTRMDVYGPAVAPPATGWPGVLAVHAGGSSRRVPGIRSIGRGLAAAGYVVYAYDVSEDGETPILNPAWTTPRIPERVLLDSAESHGIAQGFVPGAIDPARLAVTGISQGGNHACQAAAWSGRALPLSGFVTHYPVILAAAPEIHDLDHVTSIMPGGVLVNDQINDVEQGSPVLQALDANDYVGLLALIQAGFNSQTLGLLRTSTVPLAVRLAWQDAKHMPNSAVDAMPTLLPGVPRRLFLNTNGHSSPDNDHEAQVQHDLRQRWFDRFLKGIANQAGQEAFAETAVQPDEPDFSAPTSVWEHRQLGHWPPRFAKTSFHLRGNGTLTPAPPAAVEAGPVFPHRVAAGFLPSAYFAQGGGQRPQLLFPRIPLQSARFDSAPLAQATEVYGRIDVELTVDDTTGLFQLSAELSHVDGAGGQHFVTMGTGAVRAGAAGRHTLRFSLADIAHVIPAGNRLRLTILNLADHHTPVNRRIRFVPYFTDTDSTLAFGPAAGCRIDLPLRPYQTNARPRLAVASAAAGIRHSLTLAGGAARAGMLQVTLVGMSGEAPGLDVPGLPRVPVNFDALTGLGLVSLATPTFPGCVGVLAADGSAAPGLVVPAGPEADALRGLRVTFASVVFDLVLRPDSVSGPTTLRIDP